MIVASKAPLLIVAVGLAAMCLACGPSTPDWRDTEPTISTAPRHATEVRMPATLDGLATGEVGPMGRPVVVACATCHDGRDVEMVQTDDELDTFHAGMSVHHGGLSCASCHDDRRRDLLRLADGTTVQMEQAMTLCGQCHGPQLRDYEHGSHGGMTGYWDLTRGPRTRNHCVMCHDPHAPAYPIVAPVPGPRDRGLRTTDSAH